MKNMSRILFLSAIFASLLVLQFLSSKIAVAGESICFVQPANSVPIPCPVDSNNNPIVSIGGGAAAPTNLSGTLVTGGTAQSVVTAGTVGSVRHFLIQNLSTDPECFSFFTTTPVCGATGTFILKAASTTTAGDGGSYSTPPGFNDINALYIISATTGNKFMATVQ